MKICNQDVILWLGLCDYVADLSISHSISKKKKNSGSSDPPWMKCPFAQGPTTMCTSTSNISSVCGKKTWSKHRSEKKSWECRAMYCARSLLCVDMVLHILQNTLLFRFTGQFLSRDTQLPIPNHCFCLETMTLSSESSKIVHQEWFLIRRYDISIGNETFSTLGIWWSL